MRLFLRLNLSPYPSLKIIMPVHFLVLALALVTFGSTTTTTSTKSNNNSCNTMYFVEAFTPIPTIRSHHHSYWREQRFLSSKRPTSRVLLKAQKETSSTLLSSLPTIEQLTNDPFMKQVQYGFELTNAMLTLLEQDNDNGNDTVLVMDNAENQSQPTTTTTTPPTMNHEKELLSMSMLEELLNAQLSHSNGIRGFMVSYLTADTTPADNETIPKILLDALYTQAKKNPKGGDLIPLTCMNVIMPIAMTTMHQDPELAANSAKTGTRGIRILKALLLSSLLNNDNDNENNNMESKDDTSTIIKEHVQAILSVATENTTTVAIAVDAATANDSRDDKKSNKLIQYWTDFFEKWGYQEEQKKDIAKAMINILEAAEEK